MHDSVELAPEECRALLLTGTVGRIAFTTPNGLRIVPESYNTIADQAILFRTAPYSELGIHGRGTQVAFEVDQLDYDSHQGWSVVATGATGATGATEVIADPHAIQDIRAGADPTPWAAGSRQLYVRLRWRELTGRRLGAR